MIRRLASETLGTALLLISVVGSGIMADALTDDTALALLANAIATGCMLYVIITVLGPISGAHFNPAVTMAFAMRGDIDPKPATLYVICQIVGGLIGVWLTHMMFDLPIVQASTTPRSGAGQWSAEAIATFGLLFVIFGGLNSRPETVPTLVALYITGAYWFTASTSFANPAVSIARSFTDTFAGILPSHAPGFITVQLLATLIAVPILGWLFKHD